MTDPQIMIATTAYEIREEKEPRGMGTWRFCFVRSFFDEEKLRLATQAHNSSQKDAISVLLLTFHERHVVFEFTAMMFSDARRAASIVAKLSARASVHTIIGEVQP